IEIKIFFEEVGITVSNSRFVVRGQTYAMNEITSIKFIKANPSKLGPFTLLFTSFLFARQARESNIYTLTTMILMLLPLVIGVVWLFRLKPKYKIIWNTS